MNFIRDEINGNKIGVKAMVDQQTGYCRRMAMPEPNGTKSSVKIKRGYRIQAIRKWWLDHSEIFPLYGEGDEIY